MLCTSAVLSVSPVLLIPYVAPYPPTLTNPGPHPLLAVSWDGPSQGPPGSLHPWPPLPWSPAPLRGSLSPAPLSPGPLHPCVAPSPLVPSPLVPSPLVPSPLVPSPLVPWSISPLTPGPSLQGAHGTWGLPCLPIPVHCMPSRTQDGRPSVRALPTRAQERRSDTVIAWPCFWSHEAWSRRADGD